MFEQLFDRAIGSTSGVGATSGSANFRETSAEVGDTLHAGFTWSGASYHFTGECYATMYIYDPSGYPPAASYIEGAVSSGSKTLSCTADVVGTWLAVLKVWNGNTWLEYTDSVYVSSLGVTSGSANFQESSASVGDTIHADFTWLNAHKLGDIYAAMWIFDPDNMVKAHHYELTNSTDSKTLECVTDQSGTWRAKIEVWDGSKWITYPDTISVAPPQEGLATITDIDKPSEFTPDVEFFIRAWVKNIGNVTDILFMDIYDADTDKRLCTLQLPVGKGIRLPFTCLITLDQTTDFHGRINVGHLG